MAWVEIEDIEQGESPNTILVHFTFFEQRVFTVVTKRVLNYLQIENISIGDRVFVIKSFSKQSKPIYLIKKVIKKNDIKKEREKKS